MNQQKEYTRHEACATFWRRVAFVYRYGKPDEIKAMQKHFDTVGWTENEKFDGVKEHNHQLVDLFWGKVADRREIALGNKTLVGNQEQS